MKVPAFGAEIAPTDGVVFTRVGAHYPVLLYPKVHTAAAAAIIADSHDILHKNYLLQGG